MKLKKKEALFFGAILLIALIWLGIQAWMRSRTTYGSIRITCRGKVYGEYSLGKDQVIEIDRTNICEIKDGKAVMTTATCPDQLCIYQPAIDSQSHAGMIVCLPNAVIIEGRAADEEFAELTADNSYGLVPDGVAY
ncbi:MAG: NusG domain II-containing protein [Lachnospiraceae bacterium]|nr:NusG domain II-containing protein [Lachnospiraceae bacterium]